MSRSGKYDAIKGKKNRLRFEEEVRLRTYGNFAQSSEIFKGYKNGIKCPLSYEYGITNDHSIGTFIISGLLVVDETKKGPHGSKYVKWNRPLNEPIEDVDKIYMINFKIKTAPRKPKSVAKLKAKKLALEALEFAEKSKITENVNLKQMKPTKNVDVSSPVIGELTKEEFRETINSNMRKIKTLIPKYRKSLNELYKQRKTTPQSLFTALMIEVEDNDGNLKTVSAAEIHNHTLSYLTTPILREVGFFDENNVCVCKPSDELIQEICVAGRYRKYLENLHRENKPITEVVVETVVETPTVEEQPQINFPSTTVISIDNGTMSDYLTPEKFNKMSLNEQTEYLYKCWYEDKQNSRVLEVERSKNKHDELLLIEKIIRNNIIGE